MHPVLILARNENGRDAWLNTSFELRNVSPSPGYHRSQCVSFAGAAIISDKYVSSISGASAVLESLDGAPWDLLECRGSYTAVFVWPNSRKVIMVNDPLGGGFIYKYHNDDIIAYSTDLQSLRKELMLVGVVLTKDPLFELSKFATGTQAYAADTPYLEVAVLPLGIGVKASPSLGVKEFSYGVEQIVYGSMEGAWEDSIAKGAWEISSGLKTIGNLDVATILSDITGGFDSRLVLAGILNAGIQERVVLSSLAGNVEWKFAEGLASYSRMKLTSNRGRDVRGLYGADIVERAVSPARASAGVISNQIGHDSAPYSSINFQGGYGEVYRTFNSLFLPNDIDIDISAATGAMWEWTRLYRLKRRSRRLFTDHFKSMLDFRLQRFLARAQNVGVSNEHFTSFLYLNSRNRYHIGLQSYHAQGVHSRFDPLYSLNLAQAAFSLDFWNRKSNVVGLKAMAHLSPELLTLPFHGSGRITPRFEKLYGNVNSTEFPAEPPTVVEITRDQDEVAPVRAIFEVSPEDLSVARSLGISPWMVQGVHKYSRDVFDALLEWDPKSFDLLALQDVLKDPRSGADYVEASNLVQSCIRTGFVGLDSMSPHDRWLFG